MCLVFVFVLGVCCYFLLLFSDYGWIVLAWFGFACFYLVVFYGLICLLLTGGFCCRFGCVCLRCEFPVGTVQVCCCLLVLLLFYWPDLRKLIVGFCLGLWGFISICICYLFLLWLFVWESGLCLIRFWFLLVISCLQLCLFVCDLFVLMLNIWLTWVLFVVCVFVLRVVDLGLFDLCFVVAWLHWLCLAAWFTVACCFVFYTVVYVVFYFVCLVISFTCSLELI